MNVVDCQAHWYPPAFFELCLKRTQYPRCKRDGDGYQFELAPDQFVPFSGSRIDLEELLERMDSGGVDVLVLNSEPLSVVGWDPDDAREGVRALNEDKARAQERYPDRTIGLATLPLDKPESAVEEVEHAISVLGLGGVCLPSNLNGSPIAGPDLMPVYERIEKLGVPLFLHPAVSIAHEHLTEYGLEYVIGYMFDTSVAALNLVFSGTVQEHPDLKIVHPHLGAVLPYLAGRIDFEYTTPWAGNEPLPAPPTEYLRTFYTDTVSNTPGSLRTAIDFYGLDRVLFASDFPWWTPEMGIEFVQANLDATEAEKVLGRNANELFGREQ